MSGASDLSHVIPTHTMKIHVLEQMYGRMKLELDDMKDQVAQLTARQRAANRPAESTAGVNEGAVQALYGMYDSTFTAMNGLMSNMSVLAGAFRDSMDKIYDLVGPIATAFTRGATPAIADGTPPAEHQQPMVPPSTDAQFASDASAAMQMPMQMQQQMPLAAFGPAPAPFPA